jgi:hypothetical protein
MTDEELETLIWETSEQIDKLSQSDKPLSREEKRHKLVLRLQRESLERMKEAKKKGSIEKETRAATDYAILKNYGGKHPLLFNYIHSLTRWYGL